MPRTGPVPGWKPAPPRPKTATSRWEQYYKLLARIRSGSYKGKKLERLVVNARGLANSIEVKRCYERDLEAFPDIEPTRWRSPC